jgi:poly(A) polymerase
VSEKLHTPLLTIKTYSSEHFHIDIDKIDRDALYILHRLKKAGYESYLVGGSVRDLLINKTPKDFDISTSARPDQIKRLFRNALLIGRRFRLAHIRFGEKVFEVSTFRSGDIDEDSLILRDNQWGSAEEDALRRDFTINALFYDPEKKQIIDYVNGYYDVSKKVLQTIGNPVARFKQDPVRMLRLLKFKARFKFKIEKETLAGLAICNEEILKSSPARILEEFLRMLESGASEPFFKLILKHNILQLILPWLTHFLNGETANQVFDLLKQADLFNKKMIRKKGILLSRNALFACFLFPILKKEIKDRFNEDYIPNLGEVTELINDLLEGVMHSSFCHFPKKMRGFLQFILQTQYRFTPMGDKSYKHSKRIIHHYEFHDALEFLHLRALNDPKHLPTYQYWFKTAPKKEPYIKKRKKKAHYPRKKHSC